MHNSHNSFLGLQCLVLVALNSDNIIIRLAAFGQVYLYSIVGANFCDDGPTLTNDQRMIFWIHFEFQFKRPGKLGINQSTTLNVWINEHISHWNYRQNVL